MLSRMTLGERLLGLSAEYSETLAARALSDVIDESDIGRDPTVIAAEYEMTLRELLTPATETTAEDPAPAAGD